MSKCTWRDKPGLDESCGLLASIGREMCPRHEYLTKLKQEADLEKERLALVKRKLHHGGWPKSRQELIERGYQFTGNNTCRDCNKPMEWWRTPNGRSAPYDPMPAITSPANSHFASCTRATAFRRSA